MDSLLCHPPSRMSGNIWFLFMISLGICLHKTKCANVTVNSCEIVMAFKRLDGIFACYANLKGFILVIILKRIKKN